MSAHAEPRGRHALADALATRWPPSGHGRDHRVSTNGYRFCSSGHTTPLITAGQASWVFATWIDSKLRNLRHDGVCAGLCFDLTRPSQHPRFGCPQSPYAYQKLPVRRSLSLNYSAVCIGGSSWEEFGHFWPHCLMAVLVCIRRRLPSIRAIE